VGVSLENWEAWELSSGSCVSAGALEETTLRTRKVSFAGEGSLLRNERFLIQLSNLCLKARFPALWVRALLPRHGWKSSLSSQTVDIWNKWRSVVRSIYAKKTKQNKKNKTITKTEKLSKSRRLPGAGWILSYGELVVSEAMQLGSDLTHVLPYCKVQHIDNKAVRNEHTISGVAI